MTTNIITQQTPAVNFLFVLTDESDVSNLPDDIYAFDGGEDQWAIVIGGQMVNWAPTWGEAAQQFIEAKRVVRDHAIPPGGIRKAIPFDGGEFIFASSAGLWPDDYAIEAPL